MKTLIQHLISDLKKDIVHWEREMDFVIRHKRVDDMDDLTYLDFNAWLTQRDTTQNVVDRLEKLLKEDTV